MKRVGICGIYGEGGIFTGGQPVKVRMLIDELTEVYGEDEIYALNTWNWKKNPLRLLAGCVRLMKNCKNVIMLPANNGVKVFSFIFTFLNCIFKKKLHYVVIGGWLPEMLENQPLLRKRLFMFDGIYVETESMKSSLENQGFKNVFYMPNSKRLKIIDSSEMHNDYTVPFRLCTFSRVVEEKGIGDAVAAVRSANRQLGENVFLLDIYGPVVDEYKQQFDQLMGDNSDIVTYMGVADPLESVGTIKEYFALLFPTFYSGEGFAGTILDAFAAGVPVIANDWRYNGELVADGELGYVYPYRDMKKFSDILVSAANNPALILSLKTNCLEKAKEFTPDRIINEFCTHL